METSKRLRRRQPAVIGSLRPPIGGEEKSPPPPQAGAGSLHAGCSTRPGPSARRSAKPRPSPAFARSDAAPPRPAPGGQRRRVSRGLGAVSLRGYRASRGAEASLGHRSRERGRAPQRTLSGAVCGRRRTSGGVVRRGERQSSAPAPSLTRPRGSARRDGPRGEARRRLSGRRAGAEQWPRACEASGRPTKEGSSPRALQGSRPLAPGRPGGKGNNPIFSSPGAPFLILNKTKKPKEDSEEEPSQVTAPHASGFRGSDSRRAGGTSTRVPRRLPGGPAPRRAHPPEGRGSRPASGRRGRGVAASACSAFAPHLWMQQR